MFEFVTVSRNLLVDAVEGVVHHMLTDSCFSAFCATVQDNSYRYWTAFVAEYFADGAVMRLAVPSAHNEPLDEPHVHARQCSYGALCVEIS